MRAVAPVEERPLLIVANHSSWLDISIITSLAPVVFVAKSEIARWPFFGLLAEASAHVFVERDRRQKTGEVNAQIAQRLARAIRCSCSAKVRPGTATACSLSYALIGAARDAIASAGNDGFGYSRSRLPM
jgi:1-acyl-sn-glycerol-3-phosphate acyltransferase